MKTLLFFILMIYPQTFLFSQTADELHKLIGQSIKSENVKNILSQFGDEPEILINNLDGGYYYIYKPAGIDFMFDDSETVSAIFLFAEGADDHNQFQGKLPYDLKFSDAREVVEKKLGLPDNTEGGGGLNIWSNWEKPGIRIGYKGYDQDDQSNQIHYITLK
jgi:hypothetical protein